MKYYKEIDGTYYKYDEITLISLWAVQDDGKERCTYDLDGQYESKWHTPPKWTCPEMIREYPEEWFEITKKEVFLLLL